MLSRTLHHLDRVFLTLTGSRMTLTSVITGLPVVALVTTGAKSGLPRTNFLLSIRKEGDPSVFAVVASNWGQSHYPAWYFNLKANPHAVCSFDKRAGEYVAHEASGKEYEAYWRSAVSIYVGYPLYKQRAGARRIPIMVMTPVRK